MFKSKVKEAIICFTHLRVTLPYPFKPRVPEEGFRGRIEVDSERCIACGGCANVCPARLIRFIDEDEKTKMVFYLDRCTYCARCEEVCPEGAIVVTKDFETATNDREDLLIEQEIYMATCQRCGRCFETDNAIDRIPVRRMRRGRNFVGIPSHMEKSLEELKGAA